jgi:hypothetical protein
MGLRWGLVNFGEGNLIRFALRMTGGIPLRLSTATMVICEVNPIDHALRSMVNGGVRGRSSKR